MREGLRSLKRSVQSLADVTCLWINGGIGDQLMLTTVVRELKVRGFRRVFLFSDYRELFLNNPDITGVLKFGSRGGWLPIKLAGGRVFSPTYLINFDPITEERDQPPDPAVAYLCRLVGITGRISIKPYLFLSEPERGWGIPYQGCIAIQSSGLSARHLLLNKQWYPERFGEVARHFLKTNPVVQIGAATDPPVPCTHDLRGKTSLRQLAAVLSHCRMFVGLDGMPMHLARAVECPSVIVYGGRLRPDQLGYICNENIYNKVECSPCWLDSRCDFDRICMQQISASHVIERAERMLNRPRGPLEIESYEISPE